MIDIVQHFALGITGASGGNFFVILNITCQVTDKVRTDIGFAVDDALGKIVAFDGVITALRQAGFGINAKKSRCFLNGGGAVEGNNIRGRGVFTYGGCEFFLGGPDMNILIFTGFKGRPGGNRDSISITIGVKNEHWRFIATRGVAGQCAAQGLRIIRVAGDMDGRKRCCQFALNIQLPLKGIKANNVALTTHPFER